MIDRSLCRLTFARRRCCYAGEFSVAVTTPDDVTNFTRGDNATLLCRMRGDVTDDMQVTWSKDGNVVVDGGRSVIEDGRLTLYEVTPDDAGEYTCEAVRRLQQAEASITITVHGQSTSRTAFWRVRLIQLNLVYLPQNNNSKGSCITKTFQRAENSKAQQRSTNSCLWNKVSP